MRISARRGFDGLMRLLGRKRRRRHDERAEIEAMAMEAAARLDKGLVTPEASLRLPARPDGLSERMLEAKNLGFLKSRVDVAGKRILVVGSGLGREGYLLLSAGAARVTLLDLGETAVGHGCRVLNSLFRPRCAEAGTAMPQKATDSLPPTRAAAAGVAADAALLPFKEGAFDLVVAWQCLHHIPDQAAACAEWIRVGREVHFLSEPSKMPLPLALLMRAIGWNTEYGGLRTGRVDAEGLAKSLGARLVAGSAEKADGETAAGDGGSPNATEQDESAVRSSGGPRGAVASLVLENERIWQYFPRMLRRFSASPRFNTCWFTFLWCLDHVLPRDWAHTVNGRIFRG